MLYKIGSGIARYILSHNKDEPHKLKVLIGKDTRSSGHRIENILADTIRIYGIDVLLIGIITTPGLSYLTKYLKADMGMMIYASHNKATDNGIKFFNSNGHKLFCQEEGRLEDFIFDSIMHKKSSFYSSRKGKIYTIKAAQTKYARFLASTQQGFTLKGMRVALDCAFGAASMFAKKLLKKLGAKVYTINDAFQGDNINEGGAIEPTYLKALVLKTKADIGIAVDGDGDRGILIDEKGRVLDGDCIMAIIVRYLHKNNQLPKNTIVATVMSNHGLKVSFLQVLKIMKETKSSLNELSKCITKFPQILVNVKVRERRPFEDIPSLSARIRQFNCQLKDKGRILLRYSGTENLARIMVEGRDRALIENIANSLSEQIRKEIGI